MKRIIYLAFVEFEKNDDGVAKKVKMQIKGLEQNGASVECIAYGSDGICVFEKDNRKYKQEYRSKRLRREELIKFAQKYIEESEPNDLFVRFAYSDFSMCRLLKKARKIVDKIIVEIPTYPYRYQGTFFRSKKVWLMHVIDRITFMSMSKYVDKYLVVGEPVKKLGGVETINIPNGLVNVDYRKKTWKNHEPIHIMCLASMYVYQGYDRLLLGLDNYIKEGGKTLFFIHIVGDGPELEKYKEIVKEKKIDKYVKFYGMISGDDLDSVFDMCDMACSALAPHRRQIIYGSLLKVKEYMLRGVPFVYAYEEINVPPDMQYTCRIASEDTPIDMKYLEKFYQTYQYCKQDCTKYLHEFALSNFEWKNIFAKACGGE